MDKRLHYYAVVLLITNGLLFCNGANVIGVMVADEQNYPHNNNRENPNGHDTAGSHLMDSAEAKAFVLSSPTPTPASVKSTMSQPPPKSASASIASATSTAPTMPPPATATVSPIPSAATATVPSIPSAATATMKPGGNDMSKIINLLFVILLVVTAILMAITGFCMMGLRRRYLIVSEQPRYEQLKQIPI